MRKRAPRGPGESWFLEEVKVGTRLSVSGIDGLEAEFVVTVPVDTVTGLLLTSVD